MINTINDAILNRLQTILGVEWARLAFVHNIDQNSFKHGLKRFGSMPDSLVSQEGGQLGTFTSDHKFNLVLTDSFNNSASQLNDNLSIQKLGELQNKILDMYQDLQVNKGLLHSHILLTYGLNIQAPEIKEEERLIIQRFDITFKYYY